MIRRHPTEYDPEFADLCGAVALETESYPARTEANLVAANPTFWFGSLDTAGYSATVAAIRKHQKSMDFIQPEASRRPCDIKVFLSIKHVTVININGNREDR